MRRSRRTHDAARASSTREDFERFVADSVDRLLRDAYLITWDAAEAEDLVQECLLRVARRWPRVRGMEHPAAYARKILLNVALDEGRQRTRRRAELHLVGSDPLEAHQDEAAGRVLGRVDASTDLTRALGELPPRQRAALVLRYFEDLPETEVAELMGCSVGTVKSTTWRALERLRGILEPPPPPPLSSTAAATATPTAPESAPTAPTAPPATPIASTEGSVTR